MKYFKYNIIILVLSVSSLIGQESPLRHDEPVDSVIADLNTYIPQRMQEADITGLSIALIQNGSVVWEEGFGLTNTLTCEPMTSEILFEVASISKSVTAYAVLRLVDQGLLDLDVPASSYLSQPWLPPSAYRDKITIRHLISHSSGLPHQPFAKKIPRFEPGTAYFYSGIGFQYLQKIIEQVTGRSLEDVTRELVFQPLGMTSSSFINQPELQSRTANGHIRSIVPLILFFVPYALVFIVVFLLGLVILHIMRKSWRPTGKWMIGFAIITLLIHLVSTYILFNSLISEFWWVMVQCVSAFVLAWVIMFVLGWLIIHRISILAGKKKLQIALKMIWGLLMLAALIRLSLSMSHIPVPRWPAVKVHAAGTMRTTVGDMSRFLLELAHPKLIGEKLAVQLITPQISPSGVISWGLGCGIQHSSQGDACWQWGQTLDFQSVMAIYPEHDFGVVVFTNSDLFHPLVVFDVAHRALGGRFDGILRASRLELNE